MALPLTGVPVASSGSAVGYFLQSGWFTRAIFVSPSTAVPPILSPAPLQEPEEPETAFITKPEKSLLLNGPMCGGVLFIAATLTVSGRVGSWVRVPPLPGHAALPTPWVSETAILYLTRDIRMDR